MSNKMKFKNFIIITGLDTITYGVIAFTLSCAWSWFVVPAFGVPHVSLFHIVGLIYAYYVLSLVNLRTHDVNATQTATFLDFLLLGGIRISCAIIAFVLMRIAYAFM